MHPDDRQEMLDYLLKEVVGEKKPFDRKYRIVRYGDKQVRWVHGLGRLQFNADGQPVSMLGTIQDITDRKQAEEALQQAHDELERRVEERTADLAKANEELAIFRRFAEASGQGFSMADLDGHLLYLNPALCRMLGETAGRSHRPALVGLLSGGFQSTGKAGDRACIEAERTLGRRTADAFPSGKSVPTWHNGFVIRDEKGNPLRLAVVITDITERKQAEEALRASEERFRVTFEEAPVGMVIGVGDGVVVKANRAVCRMTGYSQEELVGRHARDLTHPEDRELSGPLVKKLLAGDIPSFTLEKRYLRKDGQPFWAQATTAAIKAQMGRSHLPSASWRILLNENGPRRPCIENAAPLSTCLKPATTNGN